MKLKAFLQIISLFFLSIVFPSIVLAQIPVANFIASPTTACEYTPIQLIDKSTSNPMSYVWKIDNGTTTIVKTEKAPAPFVLAPGAYNVTLTVSNANGTNTITRVKYITVYPKPQAQVSLSPSAGCAPLTVQFTDKTVSNAGTTLAYRSWDFGDGIKSTDKTTSHKYNQAKTYTISLVVIDSRSCRDTLVLPDTVKVNLVPKPKIVTADTFSCKAPYTASFTGSSSIPGSSFSWNFGDNSSIENGNSISHTFNAAQIYQVKMKAISPEGCSDSVTQKVRIENINIQFSTEPSSQCINLPVRFKDNTSGAVSWNWKLGNGTKSSVKQFDAGYPLPGNYTVWLIASNGKCKDSSSKNVTINPEPVISFTPSSTVKDCKAGTVVQFSDNTSDAVSRQWLFNNSIKAFGKDTSITYNSEGVFPVQFTVTNSFGCSKMVKKDTIVEIKYPQANFSVSGTKGCVPITSQFKSASISDFPVSSYNWTISGNGKDTTLGGNPLSYTVKDSGSYNVILKIITANGCVAQINKTGVITSGIPPVADFTVSSSSLCYPGFVRFYDASSFYANEWNWSFTDGRVSKNKEPGIVFPDTGYYSATLTSIFNGCAGVPVTKSNIVYVKGPITLFSVTGATVSCDIPFSVSFKDTSILADNWSWDFGDGNTSAQQNPVHIYTKPGLYNVSLETSNSTTKCKNTLVKKAYIKISNIKAGFVQSATIGCQPVVATFTDTSTYNTSLKNWFWDFNDGGVSYDSISTHTFNNPDTLNIKLKVTDELNCSDSIIKPSALIVKKLPVVVFKADKITGCAPLQVSFTDSSYGVVPIKKWLYDFGDGTVKDTLIRNISHRYLIRGNYTAKVTVTDSLGCENSDSTLITPTFSYPSFNIGTDTVFCNNKSTLLNNTSTGFSKFYWDFGDGSPVDSINQNPVHLFDGTKFSSVQVKLRTIDINGCDSTFQKKFVVSKPVAKAFSTFSHMDCPPAIVDLKNASFSNTSMTDTIVKWQWNFDDNVSGYNNSFSPDTLHIYNVPGSYNPTLVVTNTFGCTDTLKVNLKVNGPVLNNVLVSGKNSSCPPFDVTFTVNGSGIDKYYWNFGDGYKETITSPSQTHTYKNVGKFAPVLKIADKKDPSDAKDSVCILTFPLKDTIEIKGQEVKIKALAAEYCTSSVQLENASVLNGFLDWIWDFGDGTTGIGAQMDDPHLFPGPGSYPVKLTGTNVSGCKFTAIDTVVVFIKPDIKVSLTDTIGCPPLKSQIIVADSSITTSVGSWKWSFGDGETSSDKNPEHLYQKTGTFYPVLTTVSEKGGCTAVYNYKKKIVVYEKPLASFTSEPIVENNQVSSFKFNNGTTNAEKFSWEFGDGSLSAEKSPVHNFASKGNYEVILVAINDKLCKDTARKNLFVQFDVNVTDVITPNGDGKNDRFILNLPGDITNVSIKIFDRWGKIVYHSDNYQNDFDGKDMNRKELPEEVYFFVLKYNESVSWNGYFHILR